VITRKRFARLALVLLAISLLSGCVNLKAVGKFAKGTEALAAASGEFYEAQLEADRRLAVANIDLAADSFDQAVLGKNLISESRIHGAAVAALATYARSLNEISTLDDDEKIEKESKKLAAALGSVADTLDKNIPGESALAAAISGIGKFYLNVKKKRVVHTAASEAHEYVKLVVDTVLEDIQRQHQRTRVARLAATTSREDLFNALATDYSNATPPDQAIRTIHAGALVDHELRDMAAQYPAADFLRKFEKTAASCIKAHEKIRTLNASEKAEAIVDFVRDAAELQSALEGLRP